MKVRDLIEHLQEFDEDKEIFIYELSDLYDTMIVGIDESIKKVRINIKNLPRGESKKEPLQ